MIVPAMLSVLQCDMIGCELDRKQVLGPRTRDNPFSSCESDYRFDVVNGGRMSS